MAFSDIETNYGANIGLDDIVEEQRLFALKHHVSFGDFIQFAGAVGAANCNGGPQIAFFAGRPKATQAPRTFSRMADAGFSAVELVWLLVSHTVAAQERIDTTLLNGTMVPRDGIKTGESPSPYPGEFRLQSDFEVARDSRTACEWQNMIVNRTNMVSKFELVMKKLSLVGQNESALTDCSDVIPVPQGYVRAPHLPAGKSLADIQASCSSTPFPNLSVDAGPVTTIAPVPTQGSASFGTF
ncbi:Versatile peroxidase VPL1 [Grifola frondosa]|uniref:Peroxidase n=1 Tax=Grifola frondosa TaxID=5627 RepID=A0A1C7LSX5_GRIFR|nr:Versatile peroxidase VPL1 [Grifola frondosa]